MIQIHLDFGGFYDSIHSDQIERKIELENELENEEIDYKRTFEDYAKDYLAKLAQFIKSEFDIDLELAFFEVSSPRFYNFETDTIIAQIPDSKPFLNRLCAKLLSDPAFLCLIEETTTERSGYLPFYTHQQAMANKDNVLFRLALRHCCDLFNVNGELPHEFEIFYKKITINQKKGSSIAKKVLKA